MSTSSIKRRRREVSRRSLEVDVKETKKRHARAEQLFAHKTNCFLSLLLLLSSSSLLKVPIKNVKEISLASAE